MMTGLKHVNVTDLVKGGMFRNGAGKVFLIDYVSEGSVFGNWYQDETLSVLVPHSWKSETVGQIVSTFYSIPKRQKLLMLLGVKFDD